MEVAASSSVAKCSKSLVSEAGRLVSGEGGGDRELREVVSIGSRLFVDMLRTRVYTEKSIPKAPKFMKF